MHVLHTDITKAEFTTDDFAELTEKLSDVSSDWNKIGIQLGLKMDQLDGFKERATDVELYLSKALNIWSRLNKPPSVLITALRTKSIGQNNLARKLERKYCGKLSNLVRI